MVKNMKILVLYYSSTGNTRSLAESIAEGVSEAGAEAVLRSTEEVTKNDFIECQGVIAGSPVYFGTMAWPLKKVFDEFVTLRRQGKSQGKVGAAFATAGHVNGGKETTMISIIQALLIYGMVIVGDPKDASGHYGVASTGAPDEQARADGKKLGKRVVSVAEKLF